MFIHFFGRNCFQCHSGNSVNVKSVFVIAYTPIAFLCRYEMGKYNKIQTCKREILLLLSRASCFLPSAIGFISPYSPCCGKAKGENRAFVTSAPCCQMPDRRHHPAPAQYTPWLLIHHQYPRTRWLPKAPPFVHILCQRCRQ